MTLDVSIPRTELQNYLSLALYFVTQSRRVILKHQETGFGINFKADRSFLTEADVEAETVLRNAIAKSFPDHGIIGEELPSINLKSDFQWYIDPIDGTRNFANGIPTFGTILGLHYKETPLVGIIDHPALGLCYHAALGLGTFCNNKKIAMFDPLITELGEHEIIILSTRGMFERSGEAHLFDAFVTKHPATYIYYDCFGTTRTAHGQAGAMVEFNVKMWDISATKLLVEEAGGKYIQVREHKKEGEPSMYSIIFGKASVVNLLLPYFSPTS